MATAQPYASNRTAGFEFPKRKRWADLLLTELVDEIAFVLSPTYKTMYCGQAITELLGWKDVNHLLDRDFIETVVAVDDRERFRVALNHSIQNQAEFDIAVRLMRYNSTGSLYANNTASTDVLFDIKVYSHTIREQENQMQYIFAVASPYASRNTQMLNTILDLRAENERLQQRIAEYRARLPAEDSASNTPVAQKSSVYATSSLHTTRPTMPVSHKQNDLSGIAGESSGAMNSHDYSKSSFYGPASSHNAHSEEGSKKKKAKRVQNTEQYVCKTCGRTDSPEWRKGPWGPKTLCNACGLRWAKQMRKEPADEGTESTPGTGIA